MNVFSKIYDILFRSAIIFILIFTLSNPHLLSNNNDQGDELLISAGEIPPDFNTFNSKDEKVKLSDFAEKIPVVITFFASYCEPCKKEIPFLFEESKGESLYKLILISTDSVDDTKILAYLKGIKAPHPYIRDPHQRIIRRYGPNKLPFTIFVGQSGRILSIETGFNDGKIKDYRAIIKNLRSK
jgi:peroxiredoxin